MKATDWRNQCDTVVHTEQDGLVSSPADKRPSMGARDRLGFRLFSGGPEVQAGSTNKPTRRVRYFKSAAEVADQCSEPSSFARMRTLAAKLVYLRPGGCAVVCTIRTPSVI